MYAEVICNDFFCAAKYKTRRPHTLSGQCNHACVPCHAAGSIVTRCCGGGLVVVVVVGVVVVGGGVVVGSRWGAVTGGGATVASCSAMACAEAA